MIKNFPRYIIITVGWVAVLYPLWVRLSTLAWAPANILPNLFPLFGLAAFSLLWLHAVSGPFEPWMRKHINFDLYVQRTAWLILVCIIAHPLLLLASLNFSITNLFIVYGSTFIVVGIAGWVLLISYDIIKPLRKSYPFFAKHWTLVLAISNIGFLLTFVHSIFLGSDLQTGFLRVVWIFYGITAFFSIVYTYAIRPLASYFAKH